MRAYLVPADPKQEMKWVEGDTGLDLIREQLNGAFPERVNTQSLHDLGVVMIVDEDGVNKGLPVNARAVYFSWYPGPIFGDVLLLAEEFVPDPEDPGIDFVSAPEDLESKLNKEQATKFAEEVAL